MDLKPESLFYFQHFSTLLLHLLYTSLLYSSILLVSDNIVPGKAGEVPSGGFVPSFDGLGRFLELSDDLGQIFYNSAKIATKARPQSRM